MRTVLLGLLGLVLAVTVGFGVHLLTRGTISLPVVRLEPAPALAPPAATTTNRHGDRAHRDGDAVDTEHDEWLDRDRRRQLGSGTGERPLGRRLRR